MVLQLTLTGTLERALAREVKSQRLYRILADRAHDEGVSGILQKLAEEAAGLQVFLEKYLRGELREDTLGKAQALDYGVTRHLDQPQIHPDMEFREALLMAASREQASRDFYHSFAAVHPEGRVKSYLEEVSVRKLENKHTIESLLTAFPHAGGG